MVYRFDIKWYEIARSCFRPLDRRLFGSSMERRSGVDVFTLLCIKMEVGKGGEHSGRTGTQLRPGQREARRTDFVSHGMAWVWGIGGIGASQRGLFFLK